MNPRITDEAVRLLPVQEGRAELLEEIMATTPLESLDQTDDVPPSRRGRWLPVIGAAAAVAALVGGVMWLGDQADSSTENLPVATSPGAAIDGGDRAVLLADGWVVRHAIEGLHGGELGYVNGSRELDIHWRPAATYDRYVNDRAADNAPAEEVDVLGKTALMWAYSANDHTVIRPVEGQFTLEVRGMGMDEKAFRALLGQLRLVGESELEAHLPAHFVTGAERPTVLAEMLEPLPLPDGFDRTGIKSEEYTRYHLGARVSGAVACAWIEQYLEARKAGDAMRATEAQDALGTARDWPVLREMESEGDWSAVLWNYADIVVAGVDDQTPKDVIGSYRGGLGCDG
ncbi:MULTISPECIES: hypothetical protein [Nocardioides]|uniref:Uncharacterized protein n=1 Tax=Nocardioides vastitatis TaxID=2568655 RepID=A0ABW0ZF86_9ACTN|nr:hypothetical protein [Nocardioides sp.]THI95316.1 hypothetical protein E7Z54_19485 [Nocardioides sp.]